jgi:hypothetical protein
VLHSLTAGHDLGPDTFLTVDTASDPAKVNTWLEQEWTPAVIAAYRRSGDLDQRRAAMKEAVRREYSWSATARLIGALALSYERGIENV